jgi:Secretion system C-terminal sorting domain
MARRFTIFILLLFTSQFLTAQLKIVGTHYNSGTGVTRVLRWNSNTGVVTDSVTTTVPAVAAGASMFDAYNDLYYFADPSTFHEVDFDSVSCTALPGIQQGVNAEISMATGKIFRLKQNSVFDSTGQLITRLWDVVQSRFSTGQDSVLGTISQCLAVYGDVSTFNSNLGIYYFFGIDSLLGDCLYSVQTNASSFTSNKVALGGTGLSFAGIEYDNDYNLLFAINSIGQGPQRHWQVQQINVSTGAVTLEADFPQLAYYQATTCTYDQTNSSLVFVMIDTASTFGLYAYNTATNTLTPKFLPSGLSINELECDNTTFARLKYGTVTQTEEAAATKLTLYPNPASDRIQIVGIETLEELFVVDAFGRTTRMQPMANGNAIDLQNFAAGYYNLRAKDNAGNWSQQAFVKR